MAGFAEWLAGRRLSRIALIALLFPLPLLAVVSAAIVVLVTNVRGWRVAGQDCAAALLVLGALTALAGGFWFEIGIGAGVTWMVAVLLGHLRRTGSLTLAVQAAVVLGVAAALAFTFWSRDPQAYWEQVLKDLAERARSAGLQVGPADLLPGAAQVMTGMMSASAVASSMAAVFLGSWWAGPAGGQSFGQEFRSLRMGRVLGVFAGVMGVLFLIGLRSTVDDLLLVLGTGFVIQGLAVIHWHGKSREWPKPWPLALYLPLALVPAIAVPELLLLALLGLVDNGYSLRPAGKKVV
jgi:hypothetical protein